MKNRQLPIQVSLSFPSRYGSNPDEHPVSLSLTDKASGVLIAMVNMTGEEFAGVLSSLVTTIEDADVASPGALARVGMQYVWTTVPVEKGVTANALREPTAEMEAFAAQWLKDHRRDRYRDEALARRKADLAPPRDGEALPDYTHTSWRLTNQGWVLQAYGWVTPERYQEIRD